MNVEMTDQMTVQSVVGGPIDVNTYVVGTQEACVLIDPGAEVEKVAAAVGKRHVCAVLLTHAHFDHMLYAQHWLDLGAKLYVHAKDAPALVDESLNLCGMIRTSLSLIAEPICIAEGDIIEEAGLSFAVLHTPGHTPGCVCYRCADSLFSGDTMFYQSYGRIDLPGGSMRQMRESLLRLIELDESLYVYPGHGNRTKIAWERGMYL